MLILPMTTRKKSDLVNGPCIWVLHGLLDGVPNVLHLEETRDVRRDGHDEHGKEVMGENLDGEKVSFHFLSDICRERRNWSYFAPRVRPLVGIVIRDWMPEGRAC